MRQKSIKVPKYVYRTRYRIWRSKSKSVSIENSQLLSRSPGSDPIYIFVVVSERDRARAEEETAKKSLADKVARILLILKD
jgi:hypothetical protein